MGIFSAIDSCPAKRVIRIVLVQPVKLIQNGCIRHFQRRDTAEQIPQTFEMIFHLTSSAHHVTSGRIEDTVTCASCNIHCFQDMDMISRHLSVSYQEAGSCKRGEPASYDISTLLFHPLRFFEGTEKVDNTAYI